MTHNIFSLDSAGKTLCDPDSKDESSHLILLILQMRKFKIPLNDIAQKKDKA